MVAEPAFELVLVPFVIDWNEPGVSTREMLCWGASGMDKPLLLPMPSRAVASLASTAARKMRESFIAGLCVQN